MVILDDEQDEALDLSVGFFFLRPFVDRGADFNLLNIAPQSASVLKGLDANDLFDSFGFAPT